MRNIYLFKFDNILSQALRLATANLRHKAPVLASLPKLCGYEL